MNGQIITEAAKAKGALWNLSQRFTPETYCRHWYAATFTRPIQRLDQILADHVGGFTAKWYGDGSVYAFHCPCCYLWINLREMDLDELCIASFLNDLPMVDCPRCGVCCGSHPEPYDDH